MCFNDRYIARLYITVVAELDKSANVFADKA